MRQITTLLYLYMRKQSATQIHPVVVSQNTLWKGQTKYRNRILDSWCYFLNQIRLIFPHYDNIRSMILHCNILLQYGQTQCNFNITPGKNHKLPSGKQHRTAMQILEKNAHLRRHTDNWTGHCSLPNLAWHAACQSQHSWKMIIL